MTNARLRMIEDFHLRNSAKALVEADIAHLRADLAERGLGARAADRIAEGATDVYEEAVEVAGDNKGALAAIVAALVLWFARHPILEALFGDDADERDDEDQDYDDRHDRDHYDDDAEQGGRWHR
jgi:hypothetical protein